MSPHERIAGSQHEKTPSQAAAHRAAEFVDDRKEEMDRLGRQYLLVQQNLAKLRGDLERGSAHVVEKNDPKLEELALKVRQVIAQQIEGLEIEKEELENSIRGKGGNPSDYTLQ